MLNRTKRIALANETLTILDQGNYQFSNGNVVDIQQPLRLAVDGTIIFRPADDVSHVLKTMADAQSTNTMVELTHESTLAAAKRLYEAGSRDVCCLNFASAKNPGGGFLNGSQAQEESLARSSGLYACLTNNMEMYQYNKSQNSSLYSDYMIYSPNVPVFRNDEGELLENFYLTSFITSPAVNVGALKNNRPAEEPFILETMRIRLAKVLAIAYQYNHKTLVLGAWGCGVFANDPKVIAGLFAEFLGDKGIYRSCFKHIIHAIYGKDDTYHAFTDQLAS